MHQASLRAFPREAGQVRSRDDTGPITRMGNAVRTALEQGDAVVCMANGTQRRALERQLTIHGIDVLAALVRDQLVTLNARETLSKILIEGVSDRGRFIEVVGALVDRVSARCPRVVIFGELAAHSPDVDRLPVRASGEALVVAQLRRVRRLSEMTFLPA